MLKKDCLTTIENQVIPEILKVIEAYGISALTAEKIPEILEEAIKVQNFRNMDETGFKYFGWPEKSYFQSQNQ